MGEAPRSKDIAFVRKDDDDVEVVADSTDESIEGDHLKEAMGKGLGQPEELEEVESGADWGEAERSRVCSYSTQAGERKQTSWV